jgi:hypothetical protein
VCASSRQGWSGAQPRFGRRGPVYALPRASWSTRKPQARRRERIQGQRRIAGKGIHTLSVNPWTNAAAGQRRAIALKLSALFQKFANVSRPRKDAFTCERCTQECVRHDSIRVHIYEMVYLA